MSEESIPAWKRAGLKKINQTPKQAEAAYDPLKEGLKRAHESGETGKPAKPPKRMKVPKSERPAPSHELDQLAYLRQYSEDRDNWKFSKQKQNWILKHMFTEITDDRYDQPLLNYIEGLMGSAREWVAEDSREIIKKWNDFMKEDLEKKEAVDEVESKSIEEVTEENTKANAQSNDAGASTDTTSKEDAEPKKPKKSKPKKKAELQKNEVKIPTEKMARRAQSIVKILTGDTVPLEFLDNKS